MQLDDLILVSIDDHVVEPPDMFERHVPAKYRDRGAASSSTDDKGVEQWMFEGRPPGVERPQRRGVVARGGVGPRPGRLRRDAPRRLRRPRARPRHEPQRHPRVDVLPDVHRVRGAALPGGARQGPHAGHGAGLQRLAHRRVGAALPGPVHPARDPADLGPRGRCAPRSAGSRPRAAARSPCRSCRTSRACRATTTTTTGVRSSARCREEDVVMCLHIGTGLRRDQHGARRADRQPDHPRHPGVGDVPRRTCCGARRCATTPT